MSDKTNGAQDPIKGEPMDSSRNAELLQRIRNASRPITDPAGRRITVLDDRAAAALAETAGTGLRDIYIAALELAVWPWRYVRNQDILSCEEQLKLARSRVAVVGAGGLGGTVVLLLARMGIGGLKVIDGDVFDETNLNRQALAFMDNLGRSKAATAAATVERINPAVDVGARQIKVDAHNAAELLGDVAVVVDALDTAADRILLDETARSLGLPLVHGAIAGFDGQLMTVCPGDPGLKRLYGTAPPLKNDPTRPEALLGVPAITPSLVAGLQAMEVLKILLKRGELLRNRMLHIDLETSRFEVFNF
jgi:molybdopterin/thiamine biosynthesis adenylyltransferase